MDTRRNLVNYSCKFGVQVLEERPEHHCGQLSGCQEANTQTLPKHKEKQKQSNKHKTENTDILKISGMVPSTGMVCLMAPENGLESQRKV